MKEIEHLRSMWSPKVKRVTKLVVPEITYKDMSGFLNNEQWYFVVPYAFRDALDIKYEQRMKDKKPYMVWTQGSILNFKEADILTSRNGSNSVQVKYASPMGWDAGKGEMYEGSVVYDEYEIANGKYSKNNERTCTQMQFLQLLIYGSFDY